MTLRDQRQQEFARMWLKNKRGILYLCPRFGKIYTSIYILEEMKPKTILIAYPDKKIEESWKKDFEARGFDDSNVTYTTHLSMWKQKDNAFDIVIIDEIHLLSEAQIAAAKDLIRINENVLGLTGTMTTATESVLDMDLDLQVVAFYPIEQAITEGVIVDYQITVIKVPLDTVQLIENKGKLKTEKRLYDSVGWVIDQLEREGKNTMMLRLKRMRIIQNSIAKREMTRAVLEKYKDERILVFCGTTDVADSLGIPSYHSKSKESKDVFERFANGEGNHLAVVKIGNTGVTYKPLNKVILNYFDSNAENLAQKVNRCMAMEYNNPDKKAQIYIICTNEPVEEKWLRKALEFFDDDKIKVVNLTKIP